MLIRMSEDQAELLLLALDYFRRNGLAEYDTVGRLDISDELDAIAETVRLA